MPTLFYVHWHKEEVEERVRPLRAAGYTVMCHWSSMTSDAPRFQAELPDAVVISLDRLPSSGRAVAEWSWEAKKRQQVPMIFVGGKPDKVEPLRQKFPRAVFCSASELIGVVRQVLGA